MSKSEKIFYFIENYVYPDVIKENQFPNRQNGDLEDVIDYVSSGSLRGEITEMLESHVRPDLVRTLLQSLIFERRCECPALSRPDQFINLMEMIHVNHLWPGIDKIMAKKS